MFRLIEAGECFVSHGVVSTLLRQLNTVSRNDNFSSLTVFRNVPLIDDTCYLPVTCYSSNVERIFAEATFEPRVTSNVATGVQLKYLEIFHRASTLLLKQYFLDLVSENWTRGDGG